MNYILPYIGGPLIDVETGQVIGINAAIRAHMEGTSFVSIILLLLLFFSKLIGYCHNLERELSFSMFAPNDCFDFFSFSDPFLIPKSHYVFLSCLHI